MGTFFSQILFFPCSINNKSPLPITKSGALYLCEGYVNIRRVPSIWLNEQRKILKYSINKSAAFSLTTISFTYCYDHQVNIDVLQFPPIKFI